MILTRRNFLRSILPAAAGGLVAAEELLHPGRVFFLPPRRPIYTGFETIDIQEIIQRVLARDMVKVLDEIAFRTFSEGSAFYKIDGATHLPYLVRPQLLPGLAA